MDETLIEKMCKVSGQPRDVVIKMLKEDGYLDEGRRPSVLYSTFENYEKFRIAVAKLAAKRGCEIKVPLWEAILKEDKQGKPGSAALDGKEKSSHQGEAEDKPDD